MHTKEDRGHQRPAVRSSRLPYGIAWLATLSGITYAGLGTGGCEGRDPEGSEVAFANPVVCDPAVPGSGCTQDQLTHGRRILADLKAGAGKRTFATGANAERTEFDVTLYNDLLPGPTLELQAGAGAPTMDADTLQVKLTNTGNLNVCCCDKHQHCGMECLGNPAGSCVRWDGATNMHTHGLHIASTSAEYGTSDPCVSNNPNAPSPDLPWDDVFVEVPAPTQTKMLNPCTGTVAPQCTITNVQQFIYPLPQHQTESQFQPAPITQPHWFGLQWYHPHAHMTSRDQVGRGLAGAIVVRNPAEESIAVLQDIAKDGDKLFILQRLSTDDETKKVARLVNGRRSQVLTIRPGETQRWRILNATADDIIRFSVKDSGGEELSYYPIGHDGIPMTKVGAAMQSYALQAGNRLEILFRTPAEAKVGDTYQVTWCEPKLDSNFVPSEPLGPNGTCTGETESLITVRVEGEPVTSAPMELAGSDFAQLDTFGLVPDLWAPEIKIDKTRVIRFTEMTTGGHSMFFIDDVAFHEEQACTPPFTAKLGDIEEWTLENWSVGLHSFHIHVNPFQAEPAGAAPYYEDTVLMPPAKPPNGGTMVTTPTRVKVRMKFTDYPGTAVFHCHVLFHEDHGMMAAFKVESP
jgi:FtsP/CotA-like multicopper oxidase with cupredoxin domain